MTWTVPHLQHWMVSLSQVPPAFQAQHHSVPIQATQRQPRSSNLQPVGRCLSGEARSPSAASPPSDTQARLTLRHTGCWNRRGPSPCRDRCFLFFQLLPPLPSPSLSPQPCEIELRVRPSRHMRNCYPTVKTKPLLSGDLPVPGGVKTETEQPSVTTPTQTKP